MAVQVGGFCYAAASDAGPAACAAFSPVSSISGNFLSTVGCSSANFDGNLTMYRSVVDMTSQAAPVLSTFTQKFYFPLCVEGEILIALQGIAGPVLGVLVSAWGLFKIMSYLGWSRGDKMS